MNRLAVLILCSLPAFSQAVSEPSNPEGKNRFSLSVFNGNQRYGSAETHQSLPYFGGTLQWDNTYKVDDAPAASFRAEYMRTVAARFAIGLSYLKQVEKSASLHMTQQVGGPTARLDQVSNTYSYAADGFGLAFYYQSPLILGIGFDQRSESASYPMASNVSNGTGSTFSAQEAEFSRLWIRIAIGKRFDLTSVSPYIGLEYGKPTSTSSVDAASGGKEVLKALAPSSQMGIVVGLSF